MMYSLSVNFLYFTSESPQMVEIIIAIKVGISGYGNLQTMSMDK